MFVTVVTVVVAICVVIITIVAFSTLIYQFAQVSDRPLLTISLFFAVFSFLVITAKLVCDIGLAVIR